LKNLVFFLIIAFLSFASISEDETKAAATDENNKKEIQQEVEQINIEILDLDVSYEMGIDDFTIDNEISNINNKLLYQEYKLGTPKGNNIEWNESEQMILDAKIKLNELKEKLKLEGDWGRIRFRVQDFRGGDPGAVKLRYNYGF